MKKNKKRNLWKIISIVFIVVFFIMIIGVLFKIQRFKSFHSLATEEQINSARTIVSVELQKNGEDINDFEVYMGNKIRRFGRNGDIKTIIQVSLLKDATRKLYLIDIDSKEIVLYSETEFYSWMNNSNEGFKSYRRNGKHGWFHNIFQKK